MEEGDMVVEEDDVRPFVSDYPVVFDPNDEEQIHRLEERDIEPEQIEEVVIKPEQIEEVVKEGKELLHLFGSPWNEWTYASHFLGQGETGQTFSTPEFGLDRSQVAFKWYNHR